jgi:hypothetical protein
MISSDFQRINFHSTFYQLPLAHQSPETEKCIKRMARADDHNSFGKVLMVAAGRKKQ